MKRIYLAVTIGVLVSTLLLPAAAARAQAARTQGDPAQADREAQAAAEFTSMMQEIQQKRTSMDMQSLIDLAESRLTAFIEKYSGTRSAGKAMLTLGQLYLNLERHQDAVDALKAYLDGEQPKEPRDVLGAIQILGAAYAAMGNYDEAEKEFRKIIAEGSAADEKTKANAKMMLDRMSTLRKLDIGMKAIDFEARDTAGKKVDLKQYRGKVLLLDFWASWCSPCRAEMPNVKKVYEQYHPKGFEILGVSLDTTKEKFESYINDEGITWRQIYDGNGWKAEMGQTYAVGSIPATFLIDGKGIIRYKNLRGEELEKAVKALIENK